MPGERTQLLHAASDGDQPALNRLVALHYLDLKQLDQIGGRSTSLTEKQDDSG